VSLRGEDKMRTSSHGGDCKIQVMVEIVVDDLEFHKSILMAILIAPNELSCSWHHMGLSKPILLTKMDEGSLVFVKYCGLF
jgi:hypothetical protein